MTITVKLARAWTRAFRLQFGSTLDIEIRKTLDAYGLAIAMEKPWRNEIPEEFRIEPEWTLDQLQTRIEELELALGSKEERDAADLG